MSTCTTCGNDYDRSFDVITADGEQLTFDSIECAAHRIAPRCPHCDCTVLGHGIQVEGVVYCCANCARDASPEGERARDRVGEGSTR